MKSAPPALIAHIHNTQLFRKADLYEFTLSNGTVLRYTNYDLNIKDAGNTYLGNAILIERSRVRVVLGLEVDTLDLTINPHPEDLASGVAFLTAASSGLMDGGTLTMRRVFFDEDGLSLGSYINFAGRMADLQMTRSQINMTINSDLELLNVKLPRNLYQASCANTLYDANCTVNRASFGFASTVIAGSKTSVTCGLSQSAGYFDLGYILFNTGLNAGLRRTIKSHSAGSILLLNPLPNTPQTGDTFTAYAGCPKDMATCAARFSNLANFRGQPFIPVPETTR